MDYSPALLFGPAAAVTEEMKKRKSPSQKYFSPGQQRSSARRGSVDSNDERDGPSCSELEERLLQRDVIRQMERCLTEAKASTLHCQVLLLPSQVTAKVGQDVVRSSADEPCGLRGAAINVYVECKDGLRTVGSIFPDQSVTPTFELSVILKADTRGSWPPFKHMFESTKVLKLRPEYRLVKRKLYSSASPVIHDSQ
ncbi:DNA damage-inducible transcript 4-like protein isoform X1 [Echeneis naucrates]|uniref:DNA damage-inducible transcript 4-like protein n=1 Tax=Echeneis naucrates TaxID=173247 RepID=A0A665WTW5_ECHNA|nr:DNA damage-inducible transcript 4-like protein isoform X1 [Echeneis naucrates]